MDNCCLCFAQEMLMQLNEHTEFLVAETLKCFDIKYVRIHMVCVTCLDYLRIVGNFLVNYVSIGSTFAAFLTMKKVASSSVEYFSSIIDWCNVNSVWSNIQHQLKCEPTTDSAISNDMLHRSLGKQLAIISNHATNSKKQWDIFGTLSCISKSEQFSRFPDTKTLLQRDETIFHVKSISDTIGNIPLRENLNLKNYTWTFDEGSKQVTCTTCNNPIVTQTDMKANLHAHTDIRSFQCTVCEPLYRQRTYFSTHQPFRPNAELYRCTICRKSFKGKNYLDAHLLGHKDEKLNRCTICSKLFINQDYLNIHLRSHANKQPCQCTICKKRFPYASRLNIHLRSHTNENPYKNAQCTICKKLFSHVSYLKCHLRTHTKIMHPSAVRKKSYSHNRNVKHHLKSHTNERPYQCTICKETFCYARNLNSHLRSHTNERPHHCTKCNKSFIHKYLLNNHLRCHTNEKPYECTICKKSFNLRSYLARHYRRHAHK